jgi:hypothetical protein
MSGRQKKNCAYEKILQEAPDENFPSKREVDKKEGDGKIFVSTEKNRDG